MTFTIDFHPSHFEVSKDKMEILGMDDHNNIYKIRLTKKDQKFLTNYLKAYENES